MSLVGSIPIHSRQIHRTLEPQRFAAFFIDFPFCISPISKNFVSFLGVSPYIDGVIGNIPEGGHKKNGKLECQPKCGAN